MIAFSLLWVLILSSGALAEPCESVRHRDHMFTVCTADLDVHEISLRHSDAKAELIGDFRRLTETTGAPVLFAMNAGMYHPDRAPVGLYVEDGKQVTPIVTREGPGNFAMLPNGVFCLSEDRARVVESRAFAADPPACSDATQSGPMLVIDGALHPRFLPNSTFRNIRNGVGVQADGRTVHFVISDDAVTFHELATLFRDRLNAPNALYFDGRVSRLHAPGLDRSDFGLPMGPIVAVTER